MIYLQPGKQTIDYQDGKKAVLSWVAGEAKWSPASGMHIAEITSDQLVTIVEVELKNAGSIGQGWLSRTRSAESRPQALQDGI